MRSSAWNSAWRSCCSNARRGSSRSTTRAWTGLLEREAGLEQFTDEVVTRPDVQALVQKIEFGVHPDAEAAGFDKMTTIIEVELDDGTVVKGSAGFGKGSPANPRRDAGLADKCRGWAR